MVSRRPGHGALASAALWSLCACTAGRLDAAELLGSSAAPPASAAGRAGPTEPNPGLGSAPASQEDAAAPTPPPTPTPTGGLAIVGRTVPLDPNDPFKHRFGRPGVAFGVRFRGTTLVATMQKFQAERPTAFNVVIDGLRQPAVTLTTAEVVRVPLAEDLSFGEHTVWWTHRNESNWTGSVSLLGLEVGADGALLAPPPVPPRAIEVIGASADTGYGVEGPRVAGCQGHRLADPNAAWIQVAAELVGARAYNSAVSGIGLVLNSQNVLPTTALASWLRADPALASPAGPPATDVAAVFIDAVQNDWNTFGGEGLADPNNASRWQGAALKLVAKVQETYPGGHVYLVVNCTVEAERRPVLRALLPETAALADPKGLGTVSFVEFPLDPNGTAACDWHPTPEAHARMGQLAAAALRADLGW